MRSSAPCWAASSAATGWTEPSAAEADGFRDGDPPRKPKQGPSRAQEAEIEPVSTRPSRAQQARMEHYATSLAGVLEEAYCNSQKSRSVIWIEEV